VVRKDICPGIVHQEVEIDVQAEEVCVYCVTVYVIVCFSDSVKISAIVHIGYTRTFSDYYYFNS